MSESLPPLSGAGSLHSISSETSLKSDPTAQKTEEVAYQSLEQMLPPPVGGPPIEGAMSTPQLSEHAFEVIDMTSLEGVGARYPSEGEYVSPPKSLPPPLGSPSEATTIKVVHVKKTYIIPIGK